MDVYASTPVTVRCDFPGCVECEWTLALTAERADDIADVRRRAYTAAVQVVSGKGWRVHPGGTALCPRHASPITVLL